MKLSHEPYCFPVTLDLGRFDPFSKETEFNLLAYTPDYYIPFFKATMKKKGRVRHENEGNRESRKQLLNSASGYKTARINTNPRKLPAMRIRICFRRTAGKF